MEKETQKKIVIEKLLRSGEVDNFWAISNYILRLGAIIYDLKKEGWEFRTGFGKKFGYDSKNNKNFYYILKRRPKRFIIF